MSYAIGRSRFGLRTAANRYLKKIRVDLYIGGPDAKSFFHLLHTQKDEIEKDLGYSLAWEELPGQDSRIVSYNPDTADPDDKEGWTEQHKWLAEKLNSMHRVFAIVSNYLIQPIGIRIGKAIQAVRILILQAHGPDDEDDSGNLDSGS